MDLRLGEKKDLPLLKTIYNKIVDNMGKANINIWDDYYPYEMFENDIEDKNLFLLTNNKDIVAAFVLIEQEEFEKYLTWENNNEKVMYICRVGVNPDYLRQGIGSIVVKSAKEIAQQKGAKYLRLLVVDINKPAINLYLKCGFKQVNGIHKEVIDNEVTFNEYGFEIAL